MQNNAAITCNGSDVYSPDAGWRCRDRGRLAEVAFVAQLAYFKSASNLSKGLGAVLRTQEWAEIRNTSFYHIVH